MYKWYRRKKNEKKKKKIKINYVSSSIEQIDCIFSSSIVSFRAALRYKKDASRSKSTIDAIRLFRNEFLHAICTGMPIFSDSQQQ